MAAFHAFLKTEFSEENLEFWLACEEFKKLRSATKLASRAHKIFEEFIRSEAPKEVRASAGSGAPPDPGCPFPAEDWGWGWSSQGRVDFRERAILCGTGLNGLLWPETRRARRPGTPGCCHPQTR